MMKHTRVRKEKKLKQADVNSGLGVTGINRIVTRNLDNFASGRISSEDPRNEPIFIKFDIVLLEVFFPMN